MLGGRSYSKRRQEDKMESSTIITGDHGKIKRNLMLLFSFLIKQLIAHIVLLYYSNHEMIKI